MLMGGNLGPKSNPHHHFPNKLQIWCSFQRDQDSPMHSYKLQYEVQQTKKFVLGISLLQSLKLALRQRNLNYVLDIIF